MPDQSYNRGTPRFLLSTAYGSINDRHAFHSRSVSQAWDQSCVWIHISTPRESSITRKSPVVQNPYRAATSQHLILCSVCPRCCCMDRLPESHAIKKKNTSPLRCSILSGCPRTRASSCRLSCQRLLIQPRLEINPASFLWRQQIAKADDMKEEGGCFLSLFFSVPREVIRGSPPVETKSVE